jgi:hypothetical protein
VALEVRSTSDQPFGQVAVGGQSIAVYIVENKGQSNAGQVAASIIGASTGEFAVTSNTCPATLAPGETCILTITFTAAALGTRTASLQVNASPGGVSVVGLSATVVEVADLELRASNGANPYNFGNVTVTTGNTNQSSTRSFTVRNRAS